MEKRKNKKQQHANDDLRLTKDEQKIAKYLRFNCPTKKANLAGMKVDFFSGSKAVDCLLESKWNTILFNGNRQLAINFMKKLLTNELFHRALKVYKEESQVVGESCAEGTPKVKKRKSTATQQQQESKDANIKRKFKLEVHEEQKFVDDLEAYVWIYEPTTMTSMLIGSLLVIGAIGICMFPLWPSSVRQGVYYLSVGGAGFLGVLLGLAAFKYVLFAFVYLCTLGKIELWLLPNLTEDVGFIESFIPLYTMKTIETKSSTHDKLQEKNEVTQEKSSLVQDKEENQVQANVTSTEAVDMEIVEEDNNEDFELLDSSELINESNN